MPFLTPQPTQVAKNSVLEMIPDRANLKVCCDQSTLPQGSWDASMSYVPRWDSALGIEDHLDFMYPIVSVSNTNTPRRFMDLYLGPTLQFGGIGVYAGYLGSTWFPTGAFTVTFVCSNTRMDAAGELMFTSATGWLAPQFSLGTRWVISGVAHKTTAFPVGQNTVANLSKAHVFTFQYDPVGVASQSWMNGVAMADTDLSGMPALDRLIFGGVGNWQCAGIYIWDGLTVDGLDIYAWAKARFPYANLAP